LSAVLGEIPDNLRTASFQQCFENLTGPPRIPDHPLVRETIRNCLHEAMDLNEIRLKDMGLVTGDRIRILSGIERLKEGKIWHPK